jgi:uncharacterized protein YjbI with pentapeptide repeats
MAGRQERNSSSRRPGIRAPQEPDLPAGLPEAKPGQADLFDGALHAGLEVADLDLSGQEAAEAEIDQCRYRNVTFAEVRLNRATIKDADFSRCDLANLRARESSMRRVTMNAARMTGFTWITGTIRDLTLDSCRIDLGYFSATKFANVVFVNCRLDQCNFADTSLSDVRFERCDLTGAQFSGASVADTRFSGCDLTGLSGVTSLRGATIATQDAMLLTGIFAEALGITIADEPA